MRRKWKLAFGVALLNDFLDLIGIGLIPVIGDVLDLASSALLWRTLGTKRTLPTLIELIPGADILPIYILTVAWSYIQEEKGGVENVLNRLSNR